MSEMMMFLVFLAALWLVWLDRQATRGRIERLERDLGLALRAKDAQTFSRLVAEADHAEASARTDPALVPTPEQEDQQRRKRARDNHYRWAR